MDYSFAFVMNDAVVVAATVFGFLESNGFDGKGLEQDAKSAAKNLDQLALAMRSRNPS